MWVDRTGVSKTVPVSPKVYSTPRLSPDGKLLALQINDNGFTAVWIYEFTRNTLTRLTFGPGSNTGPLWTPDGRRIIYKTRAPSSFRSTLADGSGKEEIVFGREFDDPGASLLSVSPDGKTLLFVANNLAGRLAIQMLSLDGSEKIQSFLQSSFNISSSQFSPNGRWVAYMADESGRWEIYVQPFPGPGGKWMISTEGGQYPRWARNGHEMFFLSGDKLMSVPVETQPAFKAGTPRVLFETASYLGGGNYDVAPDGQHFLMIKQEDTVTSLKELNVILNWSEELKQRVPQVNK